MNSNKKQTEEIGFEGVGPKVMLPMFLTAAVTAVVSYSYRPQFNYPVPSTSTQAFGVLFLIIGIPFWFLAARTFFREFSKGQLATRGPFAIMPNPIYGSFMVLVIPGISMVLNWWPILITSVLGYAALRMFINEEVNDLRDKFGAEYDEYRQKVLIKFL